LIAYAPEVWLALLALVFGSLIIVVSIASENTPKLIDLFIRDPRGRLYIWLIMLSSLENIYLQIFTASTSWFVANLILINNYVLLPLFVLLAIPYTYYILKYTKNANVVERIFNENLEAVQFSANPHAAMIRLNHQTLFETVNQLHDLLQYIQFKEPKGDIIARLGESVRSYIAQKKTFPSAYFLLDDVIRNDISFRTLGEKYDQIQAERTFYEQKVFRVLGTTYLALMKESHYELASLCGYELYESGRVAARENDQPVVNMVIVHFNTFLRYGINNALKAREIRNVYNMLYHYSQLVHLFIRRREESRILQCCQYLSLYAREAAGLSQSDPLFTRMIESIVWELKRILVLLHREKFPRSLQLVVLKHLARIAPTDRAKETPTRMDRNGVRLIQIALCLYYIGQEDDEFADILSDAVLSDLMHLEVSEAKELVARDCSYLEDESLDFWEETDQGNRNIFYSPDKNQIQRFKSGIFARMELY
jgi:hypothetical protein